MSTQLLWSIDPKEPETRPGPAALEQLHRFARAENALVLPVHVGPRAPIERFLADLPETLPLRYLESRGTSQRELAAAVAALAAETGSPAIAVSSRRRGAAVSWILGSFTERLLLQAKCPILFLPPADHEAGQRAGGPVIFPTDFSECSRAAFRSYFAHARRSGSELVLFHAVTVPLLATASMSAMGGVGPDLCGDLQKTDTAWALEEGPRWIEEARAAGVKARLEVRDLGVGGDVSAEVLRMATALGAELIAFSSVSRSFRATVLGSVAREVLRAADVPIWVCGPEFAPPGA